MGVGGGNPTSSIGTYDYKLGAPVSVDIDVIENCLKRTTLFFKCCDSGEFKKKY